jgi:SAM-dependent methyltransferase
MSDSSFDDFYVAFSERFRGSYDEIKRRLLVHAETLRKSGGPPGTLLDLGPGRGEWLDIARENSWQCTGVESNERMAHTARSRGFDVVVAEAIGYLATLPSDSVGAVTAFHVIEHLPPASQLQLFLDAHRVLKPSGFLILEWPNAENHDVSRYTFWVDPTHRSLLPHELVSFMAEYAGFAQPRILRLDCGKVVTNAAMDIALVARKP